MKERALSDRIKSDQQLNALYGKTDPNAELETPGMSASMDRSPADVPTFVPAPAALAEVLSDQDNELLRKGLKELGVSEGTLKKLKDLDGLAQSAGHFLSISLEKTHRMYFLQLVHLMELADGVRVRLMLPSDHKDYISNDEVRAFFQKNYTDMVKETGNGYKNMLAGAEAMVSMLSTAAGKTAIGAPKKPGWTKVTALEVSKRG